MDFYQMYHPITATPYKQNNVYREYTPCDALKPYVRCYWGYEKPIMMETGCIEESEIVIPDTCMDIMFTVNYSENRIDSIFCGIQDRSFAAHGDKGDNKKMIFSAAIRFYAWGIALFAEDSLTRTKNSFCDVAVLFSKIKNEIESILFDISDMHQFIAHVENILLKHLNTKHQNEIVMQSVDNIIEHKGNISVCELKNMTCVTDRQLERLFKEYIGVSPKQFASMIRYQYLWNDIVFRKEYSAIDMVYKYGYTDQSHMLHNFKRYHGMSISDACKHAYDVGNLQDRITNFDII